MPDFADMLSGVLALQQPERVVVVDRRVLRTLADAIEEVCPSRYPALKAHCCYCMKCDEGLTEEEQVGHSFEGKDPWPGHRVAGQVRRLALGREEEA